MFNGIRRGAARGRIRERGIPAASWTAWLRRAALFAAALLLAQARLNGLSPFAAALLSAGLCAGESAVALLLGCLAGAALGGGALPDLLALPVGCAVILGGWLLAERLSKARRQKDGLGALLAGLGVLLPGLALHAGTPGLLPTALSLGAALLASVCVPAFAAALGLRRGRARLLEDERAGLYGLFGALLIGLMRLGWLPARCLAEALAGAGVLLLSGLGPGPGAAAGLGAGVCLSLGGLPFSSASLWALAGLAAGFGARCSRWLAALLLPAALGLGGLYAPGGSLFYPALAASGLLLVPEGTWARLLGCLDADRRGACDPELLAARLRGETAGKLKALSAAFGELAEGYRTPIDMPDEQALLTGMREALCEGCARYAVCWTGDDNRAVRLLCQLISRTIEQGKGPDPDEETPPDVMRVCARGKSIPRRLGGILEDFAARRQSELKRGAANQLLSTQFLQAQMLLRGLAERQAQPLRVRSRQAARVLAALDRCGIPAADVLAFRGDRPEIVVLLGLGQWTPERVQRAAVAVSCELGCRYAADAVGASDERELRLVQLPKLWAKAGVSCLSAEAGARSGDSHLVRMLSGDRLLVALSDGMGSGDAAARESAQTIKLLWRFLSADVSRALALETVNELMLVKSGEDMFATVDLCLIDLASGSAEFSKLAACRSLILRAGKVSAVEGGRLPLGILEKVQPSVTRVQLKPGDVLLLGSDGLMDAPRDPALVENALRAHASLPPAELAEKLVHAAQTSEDLRFRDDMTAICVRLGKRRENLAANAGEGIRRSPSAKARRSAS